MGKITEGSLEWYRAVLNQIISSDMTIYQNQKDCLDLLLNMNIDLPFNKNQEARKMAMKVSQYSHNIAEKCAALTGSGDFDDIYWQYLLLEAPHLFESYLLYMEKNRPDSKKFYIPRKKTLHVVAKDLQDLEERKIEFYGLSLPSRVGKSTMCIFFMSWIMGKRPNSHSGVVILENWQKDFTENFLISLIHRNTTIVKFFHSRNFKNRVLMILK